MAVMTTFFKQKKKNYNSLTCQSCFIHRETAMSSCKLLRIVFNERRRAAGNT